LKKSIYNTNSKGQRHGYQERYHGFNLWFKGFYHNHIPIDYEEWYLGYELGVKNFYI